jgi:hypothetical protein
VHEHVNRRALVAVVVPFLGLAGCDSGAAASCAGPQVTITPTTFAAGQDVRLQGEWFLDDCYDGGQPGTPPATKDVEIRIVPSGAAAQTIVLGTLDADDEGRIDTTLSIPDDVPAGPARIEAGYSAPADVVITAP